MKKCTKCNIIKNEVEFHFKNKDKGLRKSQCKDCSKSYKKSYYKRNKDKIITQVNKYHELYKSNKDNLMEVICKECKESYEANRYYYEKGRYQFCSRSCAQKSKFDPFLSYLKLIKKRAKLKKLEFNLDETYLKELIINQNYKCKLSNCDIEIGRLSESTLVHRTASIDRINSKKGYVRGNVQWVVLGVNYMKNKFTDEEVRILLQNIKDNYK